MKKIIIKRLDGMILFDEQVIDEQVESKMETYSKGNEVFGKPAWTETIPATEDTPEHYIQHPAEYTIEVTDITSQVEQEKINAEALAYLASTDWMIVRAMENADKPVPDDVKQARQEARNKVVR